MNEEFAVLSEEFDKVKIGKYDPVIWSPREIVGRDKDKYDVEEPADDNVSGEIVDIVESAQKKANENAEFYNGPLIRLRDFKIEDQTLRLDIQNTNYFSHVGTRDRPELEKENRADPLSVGSILKTSDNYLVLGEKSGKAEFGSGEYQLPGSGFIEDPEKQYERSINARHSSPIHRELEEEVNLESRQLENIEPRALVRAAHRQPMLIYDIETILEPEEIASEWRKIDQEEREFSEIIFMAEEEIGSVLEGDKDLIRADNDDILQDRYEGDLRPHAAGALNLL